MMKKGIAPWFVVVAGIVVLTAPQLRAESPAGSDLLPVFERSAKGAPLRFVALGGSITYNGKGWIGDWLKTQFPQSTVTTVNSGIPATGSELAVFRLERDVISHQPDLVFIEFCVNDGGLPDEDVYRNMETLIVRLKHLPNPPAIVIIESAYRNKVNLARHRRIAERYGLFEVDLQTAVDAELERQKLEWSAFFEDDVHPNPQGHSFYSKAITGALAPFVEKAKMGGPFPASNPLPEKLSGKPLLLDAHLVELVNVVGWTPEAIPGWPGLFFHGVLSASSPGDSFELSLRGSTLGLFYAQKEGYGKFTASVDGGKATSVDTNVKHPYNYVMLAKDLPFDEHRVRVEIPSDPVPALPVKIGYLLLAGDSAAAAGAGAR